MKIAFPIVFVASTLVGCVNTQITPPDSPAQAATPAIEQSVPRPENATNYLRDLVYPKETDNFVAVNAVQFDDPLDGFGIYYEDTRDYPDVISVSIYPVPATSWRNQVFILNSEIDSYKEELDNTVAAGIYQYCNAGSAQEFAVETENGRYVGMKLHYAFANKQGTDYNGDTYLFIQQDKIIKFRTSSPKYFTPDWNGDLIVRELLPHFSAPAESEFMRELRARFRD